MSCCGNCGCTPCNCDNPVQPDVESLNGLNPVINIGGTPIECLSEDICTEDGLWESTGQSIALIERNTGAAQITINVCNPERYKVGSCIALFGTPASGDISHAILKIESINTNLKNVTANQYWNEYDGVATAPLSLSNVFAMPAPFCPTELDLTPEGEVAEECYQFYLRTELPINVIPIGSSDTTTLRVTECNDLEANDLIEIHGYGCYLINNVTDNGQDLNISRLESNDDPSTGTIPADTKVTLVKDCGSDEDIDYNDLINKPVIPNEYDPDWTYQSNITFASMGFTSTIQAGVPQNGTAYEASLNTFLFVELGNDTGQDDDYSANVQMADDSGFTTGVSNLGVMANDLSHMILRGTFCIPAGKYWRLQIDGVANSAANNNPPSGQVIRMTMA